MAVLVIDDSKAMRSLIKRILNDAGFEVLEAGDGQEALECLQRWNHIDLVLVDWDMPGMDGYEFVRTVRATPAYRHLRLMMVTAESELEHVAAALAAGADEYVMKPFTRDAVLGKLDLLRTTRE
ncbi:MAG TPA: response regulator [Candidatus Competibacter sp.]|nr:response regulator [Candidatus Competibacter sp.]